MRSAIVALSVTLASITSAAATGTLVCEADDKSVAFSAVATLGGPRRGMVVNLGGNLDLKAPGKLPADLHAITLAKDDASQTWIDGRTLKLQLYKARRETPNAYILLTIETTRVEEGRYRGSYVLETDVAKDGAYGSTPRKQRGKATCEID